MSGGKHYRSATTVLIDGDKLRRFCWLNRTPLSHIGPMIGRCSGLASVLARTGHMSYYTADDIAREFGLHVEDFIRQIAAPEEMERLQVR
ncbi:MAG: hypothetical protein Q7W51_04955 [Coriobacteriia bacterium]|nr:hypothetical protein [Coriobacteriia bacterium]